MKQQVLIAGASFAGLTLAYWLTKYDYKVTVVEIAKGLRKEGAPIDVRGEALNIAKEMGILERIKAKEFVHGNKNEIVNAQNETIHTFSINTQPQYLGDIEIQREDLLDILYDIIATDEVEFLFDNRIEKLVQLEENVEVAFKTGDNRYFDLVFGADGTHSSVRKLVFGEEGNYSKFFGEYFAFAKAPGIKTKPNTRIIYNEPKKMAMITSFANSVDAGFIFRSPKLNYDYKNHEQHKQILKDNFQNGSWRIPEILEALLQSNNLYFDEVCQIHMPAWSKGRVALVGDAAHAASFHTGMGTSLAMQGASILAKALFSSNGDYNAAFSKYYDSYKPYVENVQSGIHRGIDLLVPETAEGIQEAYRRFK